MTDHSHAPAARWVCANPNCQGKVNDRTVTVTVHDLWRCGDHDERPLTQAFITCSWACMAAMAADIAKGEPKVEGDPF